MRALSLHTRPLVQLDGKTATGFHRFYLKRSFHQMADRFCFALPGHDTSCDWGAGKALQIYFGEQRLLTGYILSQKLTHTDQGYFRILEGASKTILLSQSHAALEFSPEALEKRASGPGAIPGPRTMSRLVPDVRDVGTLIQKLCELVAIEYHPTHAHNQTPLPSFVLEPTHSLYDHVLELGRSTGLLFRTTEHGALTNPQPSRETPLSYAASELHQFRFEQNFTKRARWYRVFAEDSWHAASPGASPEVPLQHDLVLEDPSVDWPVWACSRQTLVSDLRTCARFVRDQKRADSETLTVTVPGWYDKRGQLFAPGTLVSFEDGALGGAIAHLPRTLLVKSVFFQFTGDRQERAVLTHLDLTSEHGYLHGVQAPDSLAENPSGNPSGTIV